MDRRKFLIGSGTLVGLFWLLSKETTGTVTDSKDDRKKRKNLEFRLGFIGRKDAYEEFSETMKGLLSVAVERTNPRHAIRENFPAVILSGSYRKPEHALVHLLKAGIAVLWQVPDDLSKIRPGHFSFLSKEEKGRFETFQPDLYARNVLKAHEIISSNDAGIKNILLQWNVESGSDEKIKAEGLASLTILIHSLCGKWPIKIETERPGANIRKENPSAFFFTFTYDGFLLQGSTVKDFYNKDPGWSMNIRTEREELTLEQQGNLQIQIPGKEKNTIVKPEKSDLLLGTRLQIEDFVKKVKAKSDDFGGMKKLNKKLQIEKSILISLQSSQEQSVSES